MKITAGDYSATIYPWATAVEGPDPEVTEAIRKSLDNFIGKPLDDITKVLVATAIKRAVRTAAKRQKFKEE